MRIRIHLTLTCMLSLFAIMFSTSVLAHNSEAGAGLAGILLHQLTGIHLLMLIVGGICIAYIVRKNRQLDD